MSFFSNYSSRERLRHVLLAIASGLVLSFALQQPGTWLAAWVGLVPLFLALRGTRPALAAVYGLISGVVYYGIILHWITLFGLLPWALLVLYQALYFALFAALSACFLSQRRDWRAYIAVPASWVVLQYVRTLTAYAFIWGSFAHTQAGNLPVVQLASITGPWGIDFLVCLANLAIANVIMPLGGARSILSLPKGASGRSIQRYAPLLATAAIVGITVLYGASVMQHPADRAHAHRVAIIQGNMRNDFDPASDYSRLSYLRYSQMTADAARSGVELIVWPETTLPTPITSPGWADSIAVTARRSGAQLLVGGYDPSRDPNTRGSYNALFLFDETGERAGVYRKVRLVPFGEFVPLRNRLPMLAGYGIRSHDVLAAKTHTLLDSDIGKIGVSICFESLFPEIARSETMRGAEVLCVVTNDAWFKRTQAAREHMLMAKLRAIENRRYVLRAAGTGISAVIDPYGRSLGEIGLFRQGTLIRTVQGRSDLTLYSRLGQWFAYVCLVAIATAAIMPGARSKAASA